jgi:hypothetical protein
MVHRRNRGPIPEFPTKLSQEYLASELNEYRTPDSPYVFGSGVHSLWAWGIRTSEFFGSPAFTPSDDDWMVFYPCSEAKNALDAYRQDEHLVTRISMIEEAFRDADARFEAWGKRNTTKELLPYIESANRLADVVLSSSDIIATGLGLHFKATTNVLPRENLAGLRLHLRWKRTSRKDKRPSHQCLQGWRSRKGFPRPDSEGKYDVAQFLEWANAQSDIRENFAIEKVM